MVNSGMLLCQPEFDELRAIRRRIGETVKMQAR